MGYKFNPFTGKLDDAGTSGSVAAAQDGTAALPGISFANDLNTGIYRPGADQLAISTAGTERARIDSSGRLLVGTSSARNNLFNGIVTAINQVEVTAVNTVEYLGVRNTNNTNGSDIVLAKSRGTTAGSNTIVQSGDGLGTVAFMGSDGTEFVLGGRIACEVDGTPGANDMPGRLVFSTTADGASSPTERLRIDSSGRLLVGTSSSFSAPVYPDSWTTQFELPLQIAGTSVASSGALLASFSVNNLVGAHLGFCKSSSGTVGSLGTAVAANAILGTLSFSGDDGSKLVSAAAISAQVDGTPGANDMPGRLVFSVTADGASSPTERMRIAQDGKLTVPSVYSFTTADAANVRVTAAGDLVRSTSSLKYKTDVETLENTYADAILNCRPVWFRSLSTTDNPSWGYWGFIAEEVAAIDPRLVSWKTTETTYDENGTAVQTECDPEPEGVQYDRFVPHLLNLIKRQQQAIKILEAKVAALESA